jgi:hypothetical protein
LLGAGRKVNTSGIWSLSKTTRFCDGRERVPRINCGHPSGAVYGAPPSRGRGYPRSNGKRVTGRKNRIDRSCLDPLGGNARAASCMVWRVAAPEAGGTRAAMDGGQVHQVMGASSRSRRSQPPKRASDYLRYLEKSFGRSSAAAAFS